MADTTWLKKYYGPWFDKLRPTVIMDGKYNAVVRVAHVGASAYVLIQKGGSHEKTPHTILLERVPGPADYTRMREALVVADNT
jgi:hypothetical protein